MATEQTPEIREKIARAVLSLSCTAEQAAQKFGVSTEFVTRCMEELLASGVVPPEVMSNDERRDVPGTTTIETVGWKDGNEVRLVCVCGRPICLPDIDVEIEDAWDDEADDYEDQWLGELLTRLSHPQDAEEDALEIQDPRRVLKVMTEFYDEAPEVTVSGDKSALAS